MKFFISFIVLLLPLYVSAVSQPKKIPACNGNPPLAVKNKAACCLLSKLHKDTIGYVYVPSDNICVACVRDEPNTRITRAIVTELDPPAVMACDK